MFLYTNLQKIAILFDEHIFIGEINGFFSGIIISLNWSINLNTFDPFTINQSNSKSVIIKEDFIIQNIFDDIFIDRGMSCIYDGV